MLTRFRSRLTFANVVSLIALFIALSGGAYALTIPRNSVGARQLKRNAVTTPKVKDHSLLARDLKGGQRPFAWGQVREDASLRPVSSRVVTVTHPSTGIYCVILSGSPGQSELEGSAVTLAGTSAQDLFPHVTNGQGSDCSTEAEPHLSIRFFDGSGTLTDARFSFIVP